MKVKFQHVCVSLHNSARNRLFIFIANLLLNLHMISISLCPTFILHILNNSGTNTQSKSGGEKNDSQHQEKRL